MHWSDFAIESRVAFLYLSNCFATFVSLVIYFSVAVVLERMCECRHTTRGSVGIRGVMGIHTVVKGSQCRFPWDHESRVNCKWHLLFFFYAIGRVF